MVDLPFLTDDDLATASDEYVSISADQIEVDRLRQPSGDLPIEGEWTLSAAEPVTFHEVAFAAASEAAAIESANGWLHGRASACRCLRTGHGASLAAWLQQSAR